MLGWSLLLLLAGGAQALRAPDVSGKVRSEYWGPVEQVEGLPKVVTGRSYVFITHHKTGTNLMQQVCNITAMLLTAGKDQCAFCIALRPPKTPGGPLTCLPDVHEAHGPIRGTFSRFTLISNMDAPDFNLLAKGDHDFRAVHMKRDPFRMVMSAYKYDSYLSTPEGRKWIWDQHVKPENKSMRQLLHEEAKLMKRFSSGMGRVDFLARNDSRVLSLDLESIYSNYFVAIGQIFEHLFGSMPAPQLIQLLKSVAHLDVTRNEGARHAVTARASSSMNTTEAETLWAKMLAEGDEEVDDIKQWRIALGYEAAK